MYSIDDHVDSIIENNGPVLAQKRVDKLDIIRILRRLNERIDENLAPECLRDLRPYDFHGTMNLWKKDGIKDYELARELTDRTVQTIMEENSWNFIELVQNVTQKIFYSTKINTYGTTPKGMINRVYKDGGYQNAILDLVQHNDKYAEWKDLTKFDFKKIGKLKDDDCRELVHSRLQALMKETGLDFVQLIKNMRDNPKEYGYNGWKDICQKPFNRYGTTIAGVIDHHRDCPAETIIDLVINDEHYRAYRDLRTYDFPDQRNIWNMKNGRKNYALAREAVGKLMKKLNLEDCTLPEIMKQMSFKKFVETEINRYGTKLWGVVQRVYSGNYGFAIQDWFNFGRPSL